MGEVNIEDIDDSPDEVVEFVTAPEGKIPDDGKNSEEETVSLWDALGDETNDVNTMIWHVDLSFPVGDLGDVREVFSSTNKVKAIDRAFSIISSPDVKVPCEFDVSQYTTKIEAIKAFFAGVEERNLFIALVPLI